MRSVVLLLLGLHLAHAVTHSLQYFYTATSGLPNFPQFVSVGLVDEQPFTYYDSNIRRETPRQQWMKESVEADYWDRQTQTLTGTQQAFINNINIAKDRFNQTGGVHTVQQMYGCSWDDETGATDGFKQFGYDGEDFISLNLKELRYISPVQQGFITQQNWNNDRAKLENDKQYYTTICIEWLQKYVKYGNGKLKNAVSPQVSLLQKDSSSPVSCHATDFYPSGVTITWMRNGQELHEDVELGELVPNEDKTSQRTSTLNIKPDEWKKNQYSCVVEHQGKTIRKILTEKEIRVNNASDNNIIAIVVGCLVGVVVLAAIIGLVMWKKSNGYKKTSTGDSDSDNSGQPLPKA